MTREELQTELKTEYPYLKQHIADELQHNTVYKVVLPLETYWLIDEVEGLVRVKNRLIEALEDSKRLIDHHILRIKGDLSA